MSSEKKPRISEYVSSGDYTFLPGIFFVQGALQGAIYDINTGRVFSLNRSACNVLNNQHTSQSFWEQLTEAGLSTKDPIEKEPVLQNLITRPQLQFVWFEIISDDCNESCLHCYAESMPPSHRRLKGIMGKNQIHLPATTPKVKKLTANRWKDLMYEANSLGANSCQFIGGEPFLYRGENRETVLELAKHAKKVGFESIEIFTNATFLTKDKVKQIKDLGINIAVSLYSHDPVTHDQITQTPGSHKKTMRSLVMLKAAMVETRVETVLMKQNEESIKGTTELIDQMGFRHRSPDVLRPKGRGSNFTIRPSKKAIIRYGFMTAPNFSIDRDTLSRSLSGNNCLLGKMTITDEGDIFPCIFSRNLPVGNIQNKSLSEIISGESLDMVWKTTKDKVLVCRDCEYRYTCFDCRPLSEGANMGRGNYLTAPYPRCTYNPYTGEWAKGVWRIDTKGNPYYDESLKPIIKQITASM